jgi:hypothetical protein
MICLHLGTTSEWVITLHWVGTTPLVRVDTETKSTNNTGDKMFTIFKYKLHPQAVQIVEVTGLLKILSVKEQFNSIVLYALVNEEDKTVTRVNIAVIGTGHDATIIKDCLTSLEDAWHFLDTVKLEGDMGIPVLMWHIFYKC